MVRRDGERKIIKALPLIRFPFVFSLLIINFKEILSVIELLGEIFLGHRFSFSNNLLHDDQEIILFYADDVFFLS